MACFAKLLLHCSFYLLLTTVTAEISWENCEKESNSIKLLNLTVTPHPVVIPGSLTIELGVHNDHELTSPVKAELTLHKKVLFGHVSVPCISGIGSCVYDDLCNFCSQCACPFKTGDHVLNLSFNINIASWALTGTYQGQVNIHTSDGHKGCVKVNNVHITTSK